MSRKIAIIGMSGRFPDAATTSEFYGNLCAARNSIKNISASRIKDTTLPAHREYQLRGFMEDIHYFDHKLFNIPKGEAVNMDPHQRMLLETVFETIENAGYNPEKLKGSNTAVFVADKNLQYFEHADEFDPTLVTGNASEFMAAHINRAFHLTGSTALIDTSCSSSLVALHNACNELALGDADMAVVCGANLELFPYKNMGYHIEVDSADGKSIPFSDQSNGMVYGEAVIAFLLKPFEKAVQDGDHIHAVITASSVNNNAARSASLTAPDSYGQAEAILRTWEKAGIDPSQIGFIEAHGSGTQLGDKLEVAGLNIAFGQFGLTQQVCPISTVKANIGHCRSVAGLAGLMKTVLSVKNGVIFPSVYTGTSSPLINFADSAVYISEQLAEWKKTETKKRIAGVSSIGFSGTNCHLILEEAPLKNTTAAILSGGPVPVLLSSWFEGGVAKYALRLLQWLDNNENLTVNDIAFTLNLGRRHYRYRKAFMAADVQTLKSALRGFITPSVENTLPEPDKNSRLVFIFSDGDRIPNSLPGVLSARYPIFSECYSCYSKQLEAYGTQRNEMTEAFIFQLSLHRLLESAGLGSNQLIGTGIGRIITRTINQTQSFEESISMLQQYKKEAAADPGARIEQYIAAESANGRLLFIDMAAGCLLSDVLLNHPSKKKAFDIYTGNKFADNCFMTSLGIFLYENGYPVPELFLSLWEGRRIELPPHPFERIACWIRTEARKEIEPGIAGNKGTVAAENDVHSFRHIIKGYWEEALQVPLAGDTDHFFETGGDSLKASAVVRNIRKHLQVAIDFEDIFDYPVFSDFYHFIYGKLSLEKKLQYIWKEVLKNDELKPADNFFELGGHSLLANQVLNRINQRLGIKVDFEDFFLYPTIAAFSAYLEKKNTGEAVQFLNRPLVPVAPADHYALSHSQRRVWMVSQMEKESVAYNEFNIVKLEGPVSREALHHALDTLVHRHESFRTCFPQRAEGPVQVILPASAHPGLQFIDISDIADSHAETLRLASALHLDPFDLEKGPLLRCLLVKTKENCFVFMMAIHHIIFDEWSFQVFQKELSLLYNANCNGTPLQLADLPIQYKDYAAWINEEVETKAEKKPGNYWLERFKGEIPELELPYDFPRPAVKTYSGKLLQLRIPDHSRRFMISIAKKQGASPFMLTLATVNLLLHKYSGQQEIILGTAVTGREREELENQVGFYVNTLALKTGISKEMPFLHLLQQVRQTVIDAYQHQLYPFDLLVENLNLPVNRSRLPLFDVMVLYRKVNSDIERTIGMQGITASPFADTTSVSKFDLGFEFIEQDDNFYVNITYNTDLFLESSIEKMGDRFLTLLVNLENNIDSPLRDIHLGSPEEMEWLSGTLGDGGDPYDTSGHLSELFEEQAAANPRAIALRTADDTLTYSDLSEKVNQLATYLQQERNLQAGDTVGLLFSRSIQMIISMLGVLKAGGVYVPLSGTQPGGYTTYILQNTGVRIVLAGAEYTQHPVVSMGCHVIFPGEYDGYAAAADTVADRDGDELACILFTSGSTGLQKGVRLYHKGLANVIQLAKHELNIQPGTLMLQRLQYVFDVSLLEIFGALCNGASLYLITDEESDPANLNRVLHEQLITAACFTPSELKLLLDQVEKKKERLPDSLQWVFCAGEDIKVSLAAQYHSLSSIPLINAYGPAEASVFVSWCILKPDDERITIGKPIRGVHITILDNDMNPVPPGLSGKLYIEGIALAKDYLPSSDPANRKFEYYTHPRKGRRRRYDTGDVCRWSEDGNIEFIGRADSQIKFRGFRIEPEEIENALLQHPSVKNAAVVYKKYSDAESELIAYVIADGSNSEEVVSTPAETVAEKETIRATAQDLALLHTWNDTDKIYPELLVHDWLDKWARETPDKIAVRCIKQSISYSTLNTNVHALAAYLLQRGAAGGTIIPVYCKRSPELLTAFLAIIRIGAVYLPIAADSPAERLLTIINDCEAGFLLVENKEALNELPGLEKLKEDISILEITEGIRTLPLNSERIPAPDGDDLAYIIYTSGSTGKPKGAMIEHKGMLNHLYYKIESLEMDGNSILIQNAPQAFDISIWQLLSMVITGGTVIIYPDEVVKDLNLFARSVSADQPSVLELVPSYLAALLELPDTALAAWKMEYLVVTGETLKPLLTRKWFERFASIPLVNAYGPTEAADDITQFILHAYDSSLETIPVGKPIANMKVYVLDGEMNHCAIGVKGDIYTSGVGVGRGYINNKQKTEEHFLSDPWHKNRRMYKLGDTGCYKADGNVEFSGRKDNQVKVNGNRIELGEIEQCFLRQSEITDAVVVCLKDTQDLPVLVAYITGPAAPGAAAIRNAIAKSLPAYMVPAHIIVLDRLPLTPNGKTDRAALPYPPQLQKQRVPETAIKIFLAGKIPEYMIPSRVIELKAFPTTASGKTDRKKMSELEVQKETMNGYEAPVTAIEKKLCGIWEKILDKKPVGTMDNFFDIGGNSLKGMRLISEIEKEAGIRIPFWKIFVFVTVAQQAGLLADEIIADEVQIVRQPDRPFYPVTDAQKRLWVLSQLSDSGSAYHITGGIQFNGNLNIIAWEKAWKALFERHEILRTSFGTDGDEVVQRVHPAGELPIPFSVMDAANDPCTADRVANTWFEHHHTVFDFEGGILSKASLVQTGEAAYVFIYTVHHILTDEWSFEVLSRELLQFYSSFIKNETPALPELSVQYRDFSVWQQSQAASPAMAQDREYWLQRLSGPLPVLELPADFQRPPVKTYNGAYENTEIRNILPALKSICHSSGTTAFMNLLACINVLLYKYTGQEDIIVGYPVTGRSMEVLSDQVGLYQNTLALRIKFSAQDSFPALLENVKKEVIGAFAHQDYPFNKLLHDLAVKRDLSRSPLFDVMMVMHDADMRLPADAMPGDLSLSEFSQPGGASKFDISFHFLEKGDTLRLTINYNTDIYSREHIRYMLLHFEELLKSITANPAGNLLEYNYITAEEHELLTGNFKCNLLPVQELTLTDILAQLALTDPAGTAVVCGKEKISRAGLNHRSAQMANCLQSAYGIGKGDTVAIKMTPSVNLVVAILGIIKAGAAYMPVDPLFPQAKVDYMIEDSGAGLFITEGPCQAACTQLLWDASFEVRLDKEEGVFISPVVPSDTVYIIYTSGSTGQPKGVPVSHYSLVNYVSGFAAEHLPHNNFRGLLVSSVAFDLGYTCFWTMLLGYGTLYLWKDEGHWDPRQLWKLINEEQISFIKLTPSHLKLLVQELEYHIHIHAPSLIVTGGEKVQPGEMKQWFARYPFTRFVNHYGPTETTIGVLTQGITASGATEPDMNLDEFSKQAVLGRPLGNHSICILNENRKLQGIGIAGEICIGGPGVMKGYVNRQQLSSEKLIPDPFQHDRLLYRSGDRGRWTASGHIEFFGRLDTQLKISGYRVEAGEIEYALKLLNGIGAAVVTVREENGRQELVAYITETAPQNPKEIRKQLRQYIPEYMIPAWIISIGAIPLTPNGKVDYTQLPAVTVLTSIEGNAPITKEEKLLAEAFHSVLGIATAGTGDDFFARGGDSIKAIQIVSFLYRRNYKLMVKDIFSYPVLGDMALQLSSMKQAVSQEPVEGYMALSPIQDSFFDRKMLRPSHYNQSVIVYAAERMNTVILEQVLEKIQHHHDALRIIFPEGEIRQQYNRDITFTAPLIIKDLRTGSAAYEQLLQQAEERFSLCEGPLFQPVLYQLPDKDCLVLSVHHLLMDGISWRIIMEDLVELYKQAEQGRAFELSPKTDSYKSWVEELCNYINSQAFSTDQAYWIQREGILPEPLVEHPAAIGEAGTTHLDFELEEEITQSLISHAHNAFNTDINDLLIAALALAVGEVFDKKNAWIMMETHGREEIIPEITISRTVGWFTSTYPVNIETGAAGDLAVHIKKVKQSLHEIPFRGIGHGLLNYKRKLEGSPVQGQLPQILFNYLGQFDNVNDNSHFRFAPAPAAMHGSNEKMAAGIIISGIIASGKLGIQIDFDRSVFSSSSMTGLSNKFREALQDIIQFCSSRNGTELTPTDMGYSGLSLQEFESIFD